MAKMTVEQAKKSIISQIRKKGGLFENCGQKELREFETGSKDYNELSIWVDSLDYPSIQQYLQ